MPDFEKGAVTVIADPDDHAALGEVLAAMRAQSGDGNDGGTEVMVILGTDADYVWPPGTDRSRIAPCLIDARTAGCELNALL
jgi:hypothetical protein